MLKMQIDLHRFGLFDEGSIFEASIYNNMTSGNHDIGNYVAHYRLLIWGKETEGTVFVDNYERQKPVVYLVREICDAIIQDMEGEQDAGNEPELRVCFEVDYPTSRDSG